jgi:formylglycine-generating enzyme required for sulfatase activity
MVMNGKRPLLRKGWFFLKGGYFRMGNDSVCRMPPRKQRSMLTPFWMDVYPVTVSQYEKYLKETGAAEPAFWRNPQFNGPEQPVVGITWEECTGLRCVAGQATAHGSAMGICRTGP